MASQSPEKTCARTTSEPNPVDFVVGAAHLLVTAWLVKGSLLHRADFAPVTEAGLSKFGTRPLTFICAICWTSGANFGVEKVPVTTAGTTSSPIVG